jgi:Cu-Zn family superoxide dismutase
MQTNKFTVMEIIGRSIIIHQDEDDLGKGNFDDSHTTGHSGARIACSVIGISKDCK